MSRLAIPLIVVLAASVAPHSPTRGGELAVEAKSPAPGAGRPVGCRRPSAGSPAVEPPELFSRRGELNVKLDYVSSVDGVGRKLFCFVTPDGLESPTLHVRPGDALNIRLRNLVTATPRDKTPTMTMTVAAADRCGATAMDATSVNIHFHGAHISPNCHSDDVLHTLVNSGETFDYHVVFPRTQSPGLYWYHPHVHGQSEQALAGGASGAIVVDGVEKLQPAVTGLPERTLIVRDQTVAGDPAPGGAVPTTDVTLNYVPISYPALAPAVIGTAPGRKEFWRVLNASADTVVDLALVYDGVAQPMDVVGLDGVPVGSHGGASRGHALSLRHVLIPAAGRAEFVVETPSEKVASASLVTRAIALGPDGDNDIARTLARLVLERPDTLTPLRAMPRLDASPRPAAPTSGDREAARVTAQRRLYFSETLLDPYNPGSESKYFITVDGATPRTFSPGQPPAIVTTEGAREEWTVENRSREMHEFHVHQVHFKLVKRDGLPLPPEERQDLDTAVVPFWTGKGPYPSITVMIDFSGVTGDLLYHCHLLDHEDGGMMAIVRVLPQDRSRLARSARASTPTLVEERSTEARRADR